MNPSLYIFLISDDVRAVSVSYDNDGGDPPRPVRTYTFKTFDKSLQPGDFVIVPTDTRWKMTVCRVEEVDIDIDLEQRGIDFKWIIGKVDRAAYEEILDQETEAIAKIRSAEKKRKRKKLRNSLIEDYEDEVKSLPLYTTKDNGESPASERRPPEPRHFKDKAGLSQPDDDEIPF